MSPATVRVTQTTTTSSTTASVLLVNTGYLKSKLGILKLLILVLSIICLTLTFIQTSQYSYYGGWGYGFYARDFFLILVTTCHFYITLVMMVTSLFSLTSASLLQKLTFDFVYHFLACLFYLLTGLWVLIDAYENRPKTIVAASVVALFIALLHLIHGILSYRSSRYH